MKNHQKIASVLIRIAPIPPGLQNAILAVFIPLYSSFPSFPFSFPFSSSLLAPLASLFEGKRPDCRLFGAYPFPFPSPLSLLPSPFPLFLSFLLPYLLRFLPSLFIWCSKGKGDIECLSTLKHLITISKRFHQYPISILFGQVFADFYSSKSPSLSLVPAVSFYVLFLLILSYLFPFPLFQLVKKLLDAATSEDQNVHSQAHSAKNITLLVLGGVGTVLLFLFGFYISKRALDTAKKLKEEEEALLEQNIELEEITIGEDSSLAEDASHTSEIELDSPDSAPLDLMEVSSKLIDEDMTGGASKAINIDDIEDTDLHLPTSDSIEIEIDPSPSIGRFQQMEDLIEPDEPL